MSFFSDSPVDIMKVINLCLTAHLVGPLSVANGVQHLRNPKIQAQKCRRCTFKRVLKIMAFVIPPIMTSLSLIFITLVFYGAFRPVHGSVWLLYCYILTTQMSNTRQLITFHDFYRFLPAWHLSKCMMVPTKMPSPSSLYARMPTGVRRAHVGHVLRKDLPRVRLPNGVSVRGVSRHFEERKPLGLSPRQCRYEFSRISPGVCYGCLFRWLISPRACSHSP